MPPVSASPAADSAPLWHRVWLALLAPFYFISPLALLSLPSLRTLPRSAQGLLLVYALSQQLPALLTSSPVEASLLALARTLLMGGLIGMGVQWRRSERLMPLGIGLILVFATALVISLVNGVPLLSSRLSHPYMTSITLGLAGALAFWLGLFGQGKPWWRVLLGAAGLALLLLSASRGPLLAALVGGAAGLLVRGNRRTLLGAGAALLVGAAFALVNLRSGHDLMSRLVQADTNGRDLVWASTLSAVQSAPLSGVGSYLLGRHLQPPSAYCELWIGPNGTLTCPTWVQNLGSPWLIAHNGPLQQLAETGPLGLMGLFLLIGGALFTAFSSRDALGSALLTGLLVATATDNTLLVPSPFFAEAFWIIVGIQLARMHEFRVPHGLTGAVTLAALAFPVWASATDTRSRANLTGALQFIHAPSQVSSAENYSTYSTWRLPPGEYRLLLRSCVESCAVVRLTSLDTRSQEEVSLEMTGTIRDVPTQKLQLQLYPAASGASTIPLATYEWPVRRQP